MSPFPPPEVTDASMPSRHDRCLTGFYVVISCLLILGFLGGWFWTLIPKWPFDAEEARRRQTATAKRLGLPIEKTVDLGKGVMLELVLIPPGQFDMGSPPTEAGRQGDEILHRARITKAFYMARYEITEGVWNRVMDRPLNPLSGSKFPQNITWVESRAFVDKLNKASKEQGCFRLPTEAEWEWACRAGSNGRFCFGDNDNMLGEYAWYSANSGGMARPVGTRKPNAWGLYDMHGNKWEWCSDWCSASYYTKSPKDDPQGPSKPVEGSLRVLRGGYYDALPAGCRSACRYYGDPAYTSYSYCGFRVVLEVGSVPAVAAGKGVAGSEAPKKAEPSKGVRVRRGRPAGTASGGDSLLVSGPTGLAPSGLIYC